MTPTLGEMSEDPTDRAPAEELAAAIRRMRADANVSGIELARLIGTSQATVSRYESGRLVPTMLAAGRVGWALRAPAAERRQLVELARTVAEERAGIVPKRVLLQQGAAHLQRRISHHERRARTISTFHPMIVPGLVQSEGYVRAIAAGQPKTPDAEREKWVTERLARQMQLGEPGKAGVQIVAESALHWGAAGPAVMMEQCEYLAGLAVTDSPWRVGVVPRAQQIGVTPLFVSNGFTLLDSGSVYLGTSVGNALTTDPEVVQDHLDLFARIEAMALFGEEAAAVFRQVADLYRADLA